MPMIPVPITYADAFFNGFIPPPEEDPDKAADDVACFLAKGRNERGEMFVGEECKEWK